MNLFRKDKSWVNRVIFPAPQPPTYDATMLDALCWIPRRHATKRRVDESPHDPNSVPCLFYPYNRAGGANAVLLYCHGNSEDLGNLPGILRRLRDCLKCHVIGVEYPGYGINQGGTPSETGLNNDVLVVYSFLRHVCRWPAENIILFGFSIGTGPTTQLASREHVGGLVLIAPYTSIRDMVKELLPTGVGKVAQYLISNRFVSSRAIKTAVCPTLFIHGRNDSLIPFSHSEVLYENSGSSRKQLYLSEEMDHCFNDVEFDAYILFPVMEFLERELKGPHRRLEFPPYVFTKPDSPLGDPIDPENPVPILLRQDSGAELAPIVHHEDESHEFGDVRKQQEAARPDWSCRRCTYVNPGPNSFCEMCEASWHTHAIPISNVARGASKSNDAGADDDDADDDAPDDQQLAAMWACAMCTLLNDPKLAVCAVCASPKPPGSLTPEAALARSKSPAGAPESATDHWQCPVCTLRNPAANVTCGVCLTPKPALVLDAADVIAEEQADEHVPAQASAVPAVAAMPAAASASGGKRKSPKPAGEESDPLATDASPSAPSLD